MLTKNTEILRAEVERHLAADALVKGRYWTAGSGAAHDTKEIGA
ncbi:hypothetical protein [Roseicitreum antarcticum]|nr:hypothetical protein [Roseicitreum antarcticum]